MNIALIGLGMVAATHVDAIHGSDQGLALHGVLGRDPERAAQFGARHDAQVYGSVDEIAQDAQVDFVILATPPDARMAIMQTLVDARKPVLMEKPIERDLAAATQIVTLCEAANVPMGVVFQHRAREASIALKSAIDSGVLGQIASVELRVPWWRDQSYYDAPGRGSYARDGGGVMISQAIHTLDLAIWLLGPVAHVQALMRTTHMHQLEAENWAGGLVEFKSGAVGTLMATTGAYPGAAESIQIQGTKAAAHLASGMLTLTHMDGQQQTFGASAGTGGGADPMGFTHAWHQSMIENFADSLRQGRAPMADGRGALHSHALIDAMQRASRSGQRTGVAT